MKPYISGMLLVAVAAPVQADHFSDSWYWHAFASQAAIHTSDNNVFGQSDDGLSTELRELGLVLGAQPLRDLHLVAQVLSRQAGEVDETDFRVDYAFASYTAYSGLDGALGIKAGRIRAPLGFYNETRDVAHTRPSILLPQSVYPERLRNFTFARDGAQLYGSYQQGLGTLSWDLSFSQVALSEEDYPEIIEQDRLAGQVETPFTPIARILWDWDVGRVRLGLTYADYSANYRAGALDFFQDADLTFEYWVASAEYNSADWSLISEYSTFKSNIGDLLPPHIPGLRYDVEGHGYYVQGVYRFSPGWDAFVRWDAAYSEKSQRDNPLYYSKDLTLGLGWRPDSNWLLRAEWHNVDGLSTLSKRENRVEDMDRRWQMVLFQASYRF